MLVALSALTACRREPTTQRRPWRELMAELADTARIARLDQPGSRMSSSFDPQGGNDDYNQFIRKMPDGKWVIADFQGPGVVRRFWMTGTNIQTNHLYFYFDGEDRPRAVRTLWDYFWGNEYVSPEDVWENICYYNYLPIGFSNRLVIATDPCGAPRQFPWQYYQVEASAPSLPGETDFEFIPEKPTPEDLAVVDLVRRAWKPGWIRWEPEQGEGIHHGGQGGAGETEGDAKAEGGDERPTSDVQHSTLNASPSSAPRPLGSDLRLTGPAIIRALRITADLSAIELMAARERAMESLVLRMEWNGSGVASVECPLGDFFGSIWRRRRFDSLYLGMMNDTFFSRFPMPFETAARLWVENEGSNGVPVMIEADTEPLPEWDPAWGYFHAAWNRSDPGQVGTPHPVVRARGRGKYVGCTLGFANQQNSFWILESDETIRVDDAWTWQGTATEDYFNGGFYYGHVIDQPLSGLLWKSPFATVQYRFHLPDPVAFRQSVDMTFERGPGNRTPAWLQSVGYYYLDRPQSSGSTLLPPARREPPQDRFEDPMVMYQLLQPERLGDWRGAHDLAAAYLERQPDSPLAPLLRLRLLAYRELYDGLDAVRDDYRRLAAATNDAAVASQAKALLWFHENPRHALLGVYCNARTTVYVDGTEIGTVDHPLAMGVFPLVLAPGRHVMVLKATMSRDGPWVQACVRTSAGFAGTHVGEWLTSRSAETGMMDLGCDDSHWVAAGRKRDIPEEPMSQPVVVWQLQPNAFVGLQSQVQGLAAPGWDKPGDTVWFRGELNVER